MNLIDVKSPADLKGLSISELTDLTAQARQASGLLPAQQKADP